MRKRDSEKRNRHFYLQFVLIPQDFVRGLIEELQNHINQRLNHTDPRGNGVVRQRKNFDQI
jgi:hypothetical protein